MSRKVHDQLAKEYLEALLEEVGQVQTSYEIPKHEFQIDVRFFPTATPAAFQPFGLLGQLVTTPCFLEPFWNPLSKQDVRTCLLKLLLVHHQWYTQARQQKQPLSEDQFPRLWIIATSASQDLLKGFHAQPQEAPWTGVSLMGDSLKAAVVVVNQLLITPETLWLRLLGRGTTLEVAIQELLALPDDSPLRRKVVEVLADYHLFNLDPQPTSEEEKELFMRLSPVYLKWREETLQQGVQQGLQQGVQQGVQQERRHVTEQLLKTRFGGVDEALLTVLNRVLQLPPEESLPLLLRLSREELVAKFAT
jgi:hypothetical protein